MQITGSSVYSNLPSFISVMNPSRFYNEIFLSNPHLLYITLRSFGIYCRNQNLTCQMISKSCWQVLHLQNGVPYHRPVFVHTENKRDIKDIIFLHIISKNMEGGQNCEVLWLACRKCWAREGLTRPIWFPFFHLERVALQTSVKQQVSQCHGKSNPILASWNPKLGLLLQLPRTRTCSRCIRSTEFSLLFLLYSFYSCQAGYEGKKMMQQSESP